MSKNNIKQGAKFLYKSVKLRKQDIEYLLENYSIGNLIKYQQLKKGFSNTVVYLKNTRGEYILRIIEKNNPERVHYEIELIDFIKGLPTPRLVKTNNGQILENYDKIHKSFIYKYLPGQQPDRLNIIQLRAVGCFLGKFHRQSVKFKSDIPRIEWYNYNAKSFQSIIKVCKKVIIKSIKTQVSYIEENLPYYFLSRLLPKGAMHIDLKPENVLFIGNKLTGVVDFDNSYQGPLVLDLANTMMWFCSKEGNFNIKKALAIYQAYKQTRKINFKEVNSLYDALHYAFLSHVLIDIYLLVNNRLPLKYINWGIKNLLKTEQALIMTKKSFQHIFN